VVSPNDTELHADLAGLPYIVCVTDRRTSGGGDSIQLDPKDPHDKTVVTSLTEGHRLASDYFLDGLCKPEWVEEKTEKEKDKETTTPAHWKGQTFRDKLREEFGITTIRKNGKCFIHPEDWWQIYKTVFQYDPNSLVHGIWLVNEQIKISRLLTASLEGFGAARVGRTGVKFDRLGKTLSGQPIFAVDEETAREIRATFILDLALLRSYGRSDKGLNDNQKKLLLGLALWKIKSLLAQPFRFRSQCYLQCTRVVLSPDGKASSEESDKEPGLPALLSNLSISQLIKDCKFSGEMPTKVYYPANELFKVGKEGDAAADDKANDNNEAPPEGD
jgi:CRISPR-associated protein Csb1